MILDPPTFKCRAHGHDLTERVKLALDLEDREVPPVAFPGKQQRTDNRFQVQVTCPGDSGPHTVICSGVQR